MDLSNLKTAANARLNKAYDTLGARPGPGIDIWIKPTNPISANWEVEGKTECGTRWLRHQKYERLIDNTRLAIMKQQAADWGLSFHTDWSCVINEME